MYVETKTLPKFVQSCLKKLGYHKRDIEVETRETISPLSAGGTGVRYYFAIVNLETNEFNVAMGSWGGANMFNPQNQVDLDSADYTIPTNGLVIKGCEGHYNYATIYVGSANVAGLLPAPASVSDRQKRILDIFGSYKSAYRREEFARAGITEAEIVELVAGGFLKQNKAGARQLTTAGKNARN